MDLGTTGSILSFALKLEKEVNAFYNHHISSIRNTSLKQAFEEIQKAQRKRERVLSRFRRENVTEMILEPIHGFSSDEYDLGIASEDHQDDSSLQASAIRIEENLQLFFLNASEKTRFLPEVSDQLKRFSDGAGNHIMLLKSVKFSSS
jgi:hypothetical protein